MFKRKKALKVVVGFIIFILAGMALFSFEEAVFNPIINGIVGIFGDSWVTYLAILVFSCVALVYIFGKDLPFSN